MVKTWKISFEIFSYETRDHWARILAGLLSFAPLLLKYSKQQYQVFVHGCVICINKQFLMKLFLIALLVMWNKYVLYIHSVYTAKKQVVIATNKWLDSSQVWYRTGNWVKILILQILSAFEHGYIDFLHVLHIVWVSINFDLGMLR